MNSYRFKWSKRYVVLFIIAMFTHLPATKAAFPIRSNSVITHETNLGLPSQTIENDTDAHKKDIDPSKDTKGKLLNAVSFALAVFGLTLGILSIAVNAIPMALLVGLSGLIMIGAGGVIGLKNSIEPSHKKHVKFTTKRHRTLSLLAVLIAFLVLLPVITCVSLLYMIADGLRITRNKKKSS